ncbi:Forkhead transcription factor [Neonectria magnoliae]|uniref:Forkhead transcription factor n=1 Tax=Neonectria magnoliae TaxID=2732573 RepID=A0ABR1HWG8_9HYPO
MARNTRFPASNEPLHIFNDDLFENAAPMNSHAPMPAVTKPNRRPLTSSSSNVVFNPPTASHQAYSPLKSRPMTSPHSALTSSHGSKLNMVAMAPPSGKGHNTDSLHKKPYLSKFKTGSQRQSIDMNFAYGKENVHPQIFPAPATINLSIENYHHKSNGKRGLMDAAPIKDSRPSKKIKTEATSIPHPDSFPTIVDDGAKPPHSYAQLIGMAILRSPMHRLTLAQIYKWISDHYSFYSPTDAGWQNSIRHNLSLHKNFIKIERPKDDPGKGNYWGIEPGTESQFLKEKPTRKSAPTAENLPVMSTRLEPSRPAQHIQEPTLPPPMPISQGTLPPLPTSQVTMSMPVDISSDATIPISDNAGPDDAADKAGDNELSLDSSLYSPLPATMHSSPPVSRHMQPRSNTPPPVSRNPASSITRSHKRKFASMDDSGYISSLESSAMRPNQKPFLLTSEADRPRIKRGRAEEEIARLRGSSPFSPTKARSYSVFGPVSSSPLRQAHENQMLPPLTPVVKMKPPARPPPSVSPNTNLRIHRDKVRHMLQSPLRRVTGVADDAVPWSPAFHLDETAYNFDDVLNTADFDIFQDLTSMDENVFASTSSADAGSPVKRSAKRARFDRSFSTSALGEITNSTMKKPIASAPLLKAPDTPIQFLETPSKVFEDLGSPSKMFQQSPTRNQSPSKFANLLEIPADGDWPALMIDPVDFISNHNTDVSDFSGLDILQGFEKIGSGSQNKGSKGSKPGLGRSYSTAF